MARLCVKLSFGNVILVASRFFNWRFLIRWLRLLWSGSFLFRLINWWFLLLNFTTFEQVAQKNLKAESLQILRALFRNLGNLQDLLF